MKFKRISKSRSVSIPKDVAAQLGLEAGQAVDLISIGDGRLMIRRHTDTCHICESSENVVTHREKLCICVNCINRMYHEVIGDGCLFKEVNANE